MSTQSILLESLLFASGEPVEKKRAATLLGVSEIEVNDIAKILRNTLSGRGIVLVETAHKLELCSAPESAPIINRLTEKELSRDIGRAGLEVLAIILYRDGASRGEIDWVRGVNSSATVRSLMLRGLIEGAEDTADHRRIHYIATPEALKYLGVSRVGELPHYNEFVAKLSETHSEDMDSKMTTSRDAI